MLFIPEEYAMATKVKPCSGAGFWFPGSPKALENEVRGYLKLAAETSLPGKVQAIISPHAGYRYCGEVMGNVYSTVKDKEYERVIFLAFSHSYPVRGLSIMDVDAYETPLGNIPIDTEMRDTLLKHSLVNSVDRAHAREHSDENQMPFVQVALKPGWKMISIFVGDMSHADYDTAADILSPFINEETLIVVSSDFTHYGAQYGYIPFTKNVKENMKNLDGGAVEKIIALDFDGFRSYLRDTGATICGRNPISLLIKILPQNIEGKLLKYMTSADVAGDYDMAVGYAGVVFYQGNIEQNSAKSNTEKTSGTEPVRKSKVVEPHENELSDAERKTLLKIARETLHGLLDKGEFKGNPDNYDITSGLRREAGVFVTLTKQGHLRGCIGYVEGIKPVWEAVVDNTRNAAFEDPRFPRVRMKEFKDIEIEISVMTPIRPIKSIEEIEVGKHGLVIEKGFNRGLLLPQVPVEWGWDRDEFLVHICRKANLPPDAWKSSDTNLYVFSAQVFNEGDYPDLKGD
jgi:AmmeMemoRadiSam system protein B/AmmeMemoRadiSam system protein A